ncbi:hypothetical protein ACFLT8_01645 [Chloroflexota bacterium]
MKWVSLVDNQRCLENESQAYIREQYEATPEKTSLPRATAGRNRLPFYIIGGAGSAIL